MPEEELPICCNELEEFLVDACNCTLLEVEEINLCQHDLYLEKIRPFFVSTLEKKIYALLERFVYSEDADRFQEQFSCLRNCIGQATTTLSTQVNENCRNHMTKGIVVQDVITRTIKCLIKEGVFDAFINSLILSNRIKRVGHQLNSLAYQKDSLAYHNVCNFVCEKNYWIDHSESEIDDALSDLTVEVDTEDQDSISFHLLKRCEELGNDNCDYCDPIFEGKQNDSDFHRESSSSSYRSSEAVYLRTIISKIEFSSCGCADVKSKKCGKLKLPCKPDDLMKNIFKVDKDFVDLCLMPVRRKFDESIFNLCCHLNDILMRMDDGAIRNLFLICEIRPGYISFKLKSLLVASYGSKSFLFSTKIATSGITNDSEDSEIFVNNDEKPEGNFRECCRVNYCRQNRLSDVTEEEEINEEDSPNVADIPSNGMEPDLKMSPKAFYEAENLHKTPFNFEIDEKLRIETSTINNFNDSKSLEMSCPCEKFVSLTKSSFSEIELKLQDLSECFKKFTIESNKPEINTENHSETELKLQDFEKQEIVQLDHSHKDDSPVECVCPGENPQKVSSSSNQMATENQSGPLVKLETNTIVPQDEDKSSNRFDRDESQRQDNQELNQVPNAKKSLLSKIPRPCSIKTEDLKERKREGRMFPCSQKGIKCVSSKTCFSKIPILVKKSPDSQRRSNVNKKNSIPLVEKRESRSSSLASRRRSVSSSQRSTDLSRCFAIKSAVPKSKLIVKTCNKTTNVTFIEVDVSSACLSKANPPQPAKRNVLCPNPPPRSNPNLSARSNPNLPPRSSPNLPPRSNPNIPPRRNPNLPKIDQCVCTEPLDPVSKVDQKVSANLFPKSEEKPTFVIVTDSEEAIPSCDSECPCRGGFDIPDGHLLSCLCFEDFIPKSPKTKLKNIKFRENREEFPRNRLVDSDIYPAFEFDDLGNCLEISNFQQLASPRNNLKVGVQPEDCRPKITNQIFPNLGIKPFNEVCNTGDCRGIRNLEKLGGCLNSHLQPLKHDIFKNLRTVSVQTMEQRMMTKGININIREVKETISKGINVVQTETKTKGINLNLAEDSVISLQANVTKIISIIDITIFENDSGYTKPLDDVYKRGICPTLMSPNGSSFRNGKGAFPLVCGSSYRSDSLISPPCQRDSFSVCPPCPSPSTKRTFDSHFLTKSYISRKTKMNSRSHVKSNIDYVTFEKKINKGSQKTCGCRRSRGDSWLCPKRIAKAQNIFKAICEPFSQKSIDRMKYLIRTKLCQWLLDQDGSGSKSFVSDERYYVSVSSEKTCSSSGKIASSRFSITTNSVCQVKRMAGGSDNPDFCDNSFGKDWEVPDENLFLNRKKLGFNGKCETIGGKYRKVSGGAGNEELEGKQINREGNKQRKMERIEEMVKRSKEAKNEGRELNKNRNRRAREEQKINNRNEREELQDKKEKSRNKRKEESRNKPKEESTKKPKEESTKKSKEESTKKPKEEKDRENRREYQNETCKQIENEKQNIQEILCRKKLKSSNSRNSLKKEKNQKRKRKSFISPGDMITSCHLGKRNGKFFLEKRQNMDICECDKENGCNDSRRTHHGRFNFSRETEQFSSSGMMRLQGKNRFTREMRGIGESFCDLEQNVKSKLREYVNLCKSAKDLIARGSNDVCGVSSTSITFINRSDPQRH